MVTPHAARPKIYDPNAHPELAESPRGPGPWLLPLLGIVFVVLVAVSIGLSTSAPSSNASPASVVRYYTDNQNRMRASGIMTAVAIPAGLFFFALLREFLRRSERARPYATIALAGAIVFAAGGAISAGLSLTLADVPNQLTPGAAQALNVLNSDLTAGLLIGGLATMQFGYGVAILLGKAFPKWLGWVTIAIAIAVVSLLGPLAFFGLIATGIWILIVSGMIYPRVQRLLANLSRVAWVAVDQHPNSARPSWRRSVPPPRPRSEKPCHRQ